MANQTEKDTEAAKAKQNNNNQAAIDTAAAKAKQNGGDGGTSKRMSQREAAAGLSNTTSGLSDPSPAIINLQDQVDQDNFYQYPGSFIPEWSSVDESVFTNDGGDMQFEDGDSAGGGILVPLQIIGSSDGGNVELKVIGSKVFDYTLGTASPNEVTIAEYTESIGEAKDTYISVKITVDVADGKSVSSAAIETSAEPPPDEDGVYFVPVGKFTTESAGSGTVPGDILPFHSGGIFYPFNEPWSQFSTSSGYLQIGLGSDETEGVNKPSTVEGLIINAKQVMTLKVGDDGEEVVNIDTVDIEDEEVIGVKKIFEEDGTTIFGNVLASQDMTKGVGWAVYAGDDETAGLLEIGGSDSNTANDITDIDINFEKYDGRMKLTNQSIPAAAIEINPIANEGDQFISCTSSNNREAGIGDSILDLGSFNVFSRQGAEAMGFSSSQLRAMKSSGANSIAIEGNDVEDGEVIGVKKIYEADGTTIQGNVLASTDITLSDADVSWASYGGDDTSSGPLAIGGSGTSGVTDLNMVFTGDLQMTGGADFQFNVDSTLSELSTMRMGNAHVNVQDVGAFVAGSITGSGDSTTISEGSIDLSSGGTAKISLDKTDLSGATGVAKFREIKVCNNGVPSTAYVLMTEPVAD